MGDNFSCLRSDPRLRKDEMVMEETKKPAIVQEFAQENDKTEVLVNFQLSNHEAIEENKKPSKSRKKWDYIKIQSTARGYLDRKEFSALKEAYISINGLSPEIFHKNDNGSSSSKISSKAKKTEKNREDHSQKTLITPNDNSEAISYPTYLLPNNTTYEGEWNEDGEKHGKGIEIMPDGSKYVGYFRNNKREGDGTLITADGDLFQGEFIEGKLNGKGIFNSNDGTKYTGEFKNGIPHGEGKGEGEGWKFIGNYEYGLKHGKGLFCWENGSSYNGNFKEGSLEGYGHYVWNTGKEYEGEYKDNKMHGKGVFTWPDGRVYKGEYENDEKNGHGIFFWPDGKIYDGEWKNGKQDGKGKLTFLNQKKKLETRNGIWKDGTRVQWT